jgi:hypothetical protein
MLRVLPVVIAVGLAIYALLDVATTPSSAVRNMPKWAWIALIVIGAGIYIGPIAWLVAGRPKGRGRGGNRRQLPPDDDPDWLRKF